MNLATFVKKFEITIFAASLVLASGCSKRLSDGDLYALCLKNIVHVRTDKSIGTGFLVRENGLTYLYTCDHCIMSTNDFTITRVDGTKIDYYRFEYDPERDLVRFLLAVDGGLEVAGIDELGLNDEVVAYGDSLGGGVMTANLGHILGIGATRIEVDAPIVKGNSGGPVVTRTGKVAGVVSTKISGRQNGAEGTRYNNTRVFAESLIGVSWKCGSYEQYKQEYAKLQGAMALVDVFETYSSQDAFKVKNHTWNVTWHSLVGGKEIDSLSQKKLESAAQAISEIRKAEFESSYYFKTERNRFDLTFPRTVNGVTYKDRESWEKHVQAECERLIHGFVFEYKLWLWAAQCECGMMLKNIASIQYSFAGLKSDIMSYIKDQVKPNLESNSGEILKDDSEFYLNPDGTGVTSLQMEEIRRLIRSQQGK